MFLRFLLLFGLLIGGGGIACAQLDDPFAIPDSVAEPDRSPEAVLEHRAAPEPEERAFSDAALAILRADPANHYLPPQEYVPTPWERFLAWLSRLLSRTLGTGPASWITRNLWVILIVVAVLFVAFVLRKRLFSSAFSPAPRKVGEVAPQHAEVLAEDLDALIRTAETEEQWRKALRLHYLRALRHLSDAGHIQLKPDATDNDYRLQLKEQGLRERFGKLAFTFQWVWYGEARMDRQRYELLIPPFRNFGTGHRP